MLIILLQVLVSQKEERESTDWTQTRGPVRVRAGARTAAAAATPTLVAAEKTAAVKMTVGAPTTTSTSAVVEALAQTGVRMSTQMKAETTQTRVWRKRAGMT